MKLSISELNKIISTAVKEEVSRILPEIVANHLSERFIKAVAADVLSESTQTTSVKRKETKVENKKKNPILSKIIESHAKDVLGEEEELPKTVIKSNNANPLMSKSNPFSSLYENVNNDEQDASEGVSVEALCFLDPSTLRKMAGI